MKHKGYNNQITGRDHQYGYNGIEESNDGLGLDVLEMDLRQYDAAIARWIVIDPVTHHDFSPYQAFDNNPVFWADPSGADSTYNWDAGRYEDSDGNEVSWDSVQAEHGIGDNNSESNSSNENGPGDRLGAWILGKVKGFLGMSDGSEEEELRKLGETRAARELKKDNDEQKAYLKGQLDKQKQMLSFFPGFTLVEGIQESNNGNYAEGSILILFGVLEAATGGASGQGVNMSSKILPNSLSKIASKLGPNFSKDINKLLISYAKGNPSPGIGTRAIKGVEGLFEMRAKSGARIYFQNVKDGIEILGYSNKSNQNKVIKLIKKYYF